jgi:WD40 repeat protein
MHICALDRTELFANLLTQSIISPPPPPYLTSLHITLALIHPEDLEAIGIRVWDMASGQQQATLHSHTREVTCLALSGSLLVSGSQDTTVKLWDVGSLQLLRTLQGHYASIWSVAVTPGSSQRVISACLPSCGSENASNDWDDTSVRMWDATTGTQLALLNSGVAGESPSFVAVSSDGSMAATVDFNSCIVWDMTTLYPRATVKTVRGKDVVLFL